MRMFQCYKCDCRASKQALLNYYSALVAVREETVREDSANDVPYAECIQDDCGGLFEPAGGI
jgi:hypothetical protein